MKVRVITSDKCLKCKAYLKQLDLAKLGYETYDGLSEINKETLDKWGIDKMPVVQIVGESDNILYQFSHGTFRPESIISMIETLTKKGYK